MQAGVDFAALSEAEKAARFDELQVKLVSQWALIEGFTEEPYGTVVVPSLTGGKVGLQGAYLQAYEERFLFLLLLLRQPRARMIYVTSQAILPSIVDYYRAAPRRHSFAGATPPGSDRTARCLRAVADREAA